VDGKDTHTPENLDSQDLKKTRLGSRGIAAAQGKKEDAARQGEEFQQWSEAHGLDSNDFHGEGHRLRIHADDNGHLSRFDERDEQPGITTKWRDSDSYIDNYGHLYELKSGYEIGGISKAQAYEYHLMQNAGYVKVRDATAKDGLRAVPVKGVTYIFDSKAGAEANRDVLEDYGFFILYRDGKGRLKQLKE
jgi:hypothetical protein